MPEPIKTNSITVQVWDERRGWVTVPPLRPDAAPEVPPTPERHTIVEGVAQRYPNPAK